MQNGWAYLKEEVPGEPGGRGGERMRAGEAGDEEDEEEEKEQGARAVIYHAPTPQPRYFNSGPGWTRPASGLHPGLCRPPFLASCRTRERLLLSSTLRGYFPPSPCLTFKAPRRAINSTRTLVI